MRTFTIDSDNNITAHVQLPAGADESQSFTTHKELAQLSADWPVSRLIDTWNSFAGVAPFDDLKPVKKFTSRKTAVARIWTAVGRLLPDSAPPAAPVAPSHRHHFGLLAALAGDGCAFFSGTARTFAPGALGRGLPRFRPPASAE